MTRSSADGTVAPPEFRECPGCGLFQTIPPLAWGMTAACSRCSTTLHRATGHPMEHSIALTLAALVLLIVMCTTTLMSVQTAGIATAPTCFRARRNSSGAACRRSRRSSCSSPLLAPFGKLIGTLYVLLRLHEAAPPRHLRRVFVLAERLAAMVDDRGLRLRCVRRLCEAGRPGARSRWTPASMRCSH